MRFPRSILPVAAAAALLAASPAAFAHAAYKSSDPADGSTVSSPPGRVTAEFTEPLTESSYLQVYDPCGTQVDHGDSSVSGYNMSVSMSADVAGTYVVDFAAQSALDAHTTRGSFTFTSSGGEGCGGEPDPAQPPSGGGGGGGSGGSSGGGGSGGGGVGPEDPVLPTAGPAASGSGGSGGGGPAGGTSKGRPGGRGAGGAGSGGGPVAFQNTGEIVPADEPAPWDLPLDGVVIAFVLSVMIGAAGGRVYAGIVAPRRR